MSGAISTSNAQVIGIRAYFEGLRMIPESWRNLFNFHGDRVAQLRISSIRGVGEIPSWNGAADLPTDTVDDATALNMSYGEFGLQVRIPKRRAELTPQIVPGVTQKLGIAVASTYRTQAYTELNAAFSNTIDDGQALCSTAHTTASGATRSNLQTAALDRTSFMAAIQQARNWVSYHNITSDLADMGWYLVVDPANEETAKEVVMSGVSSAEMQTNVAGMYNTSVLVETCFTDSDDWLLISKAQSPFHFWELDGPDFQMAIDEDSRQIKPSVDFAIDADAGPEPDGIFGSNVA